MAHVSDSRFAVAALRHFNRYYSNRIGLLARYRLDTSFTLTEARVLFEIGRRGFHTQGALRADLRLDAGYLHRIVSRFAERGLVAIGKSPDDARVSRLSLTPSGRAALAAVDSASDRDAESTLAGLAPDAAAELVEHLRAAERLLEGAAYRNLRIEAVSDENSLSTVAVLMREYAAFLGVDLSFQHFEEELASLPGKYAPPEGALLLASRSSSSGGAEAVGCVAMRPLGDGVCEMKRLFVRPEFRGIGAGKALARAIVDEARRAGYRAMRLDTLDRLEEAVGLYEAMGFRLIGPYNDNPIPGALFWELDLTAAGARGC